MKKILRILLLILFTATFLISGWLLLDYFLESKEQSGKYDELSGLVEDAREEDAWNIPDKSGLSAEDIDSGDIVGQVKLVTVTNPIPARIFPSFPSMPSSTPGTLTLQAGFICPIPS